MKIITLHKLPIDKKIGDYKKWSRDVDQKQAANLAYVKNFEVFEVVNSDKNPFPFDIVEFLEVNNWEDFLSVYYGRDKQ